MTSDGDEFNRRQARIIAGYLYDGLRNINDAHGTSLLLPEGAPSTVTLRRALHAAHAAILEAIQEAEA